MIYLPEDKSTVETDETHKHKHNTPKAREEESITYYFLFLAGKRPENVMWRDIKTDGDRYGR